MQVLALALGPISKVLVIYLMQFLETLVVLGCSLQVVVSRDENNFSVLHASNRKLGRPWVRGYSTMAMLTFRSWRCGPNSNGLVVHKRWNFDVDED